MTLLSNWLHSKPAAPRSARHGDERRLSQRRLRYEPLEKRELLTAVAASGFPVDNGFVADGDIAHDHAGNTYISGSVSINNAPGVVMIDLDPSNTAPDDPAIVEAANNFAWIAKYGPTGDFEWVRPLLPDAAGSADMAVQALEIADDTGMLYFYGRYNGAYAMAGASLAEIGDSGPDHFVGKVSPGGTVEWLTGLELSSLEGPASEGAGLAVDEAHGRLYVAARPGTHEGLVIAVDIATPSPAVAWLATLPVSSSYGHSTAKDVDVDAAGSVYVVGTFSGTADFDPSSGSFLVSSGSGKQPPSAGYAWKLTNQGKLSWAMAFKGSKGSYSAAGQVQVDVRDGVSSVIVSGGFGGTIDFDPSKKTTNLTSNGASDAFLLRMSSSGMLATAHRYGTSGYETPTGMTVDLSGNIYLAGSTFVAKFRSDGLLEWSQTLAGTLDVGGISIAPDGKVHLSGRYYGALYTSSDLVLDSGDDSTDLYWLIF